MAFTIATDYLRYNGTYWEESEHAVTLAMIEHTDVQLAEAEKQVEASLLKLESLGVARDAAINGGKSFEIVWTRNRSPHTRSISTMPLSRRLS